MKIELKNIKHSPSLSEETEAFTANLYINGKHVGYAKNQGRGGPTDYYATDQEGQKLIREAETFCKALPEKQYPAGNGMEAFSVGMDLENFIDDLLNDHLRQKDILRFNTKINKAMQSGVVFGIPDQSFGAVTYRITLDKLLALPDGPVKLMAMIKKDILPKLKGGAIVLNTNIPEQLLKDAGLKPGQYTKPAIGPGKETKPKSSKKTGKKI